MTKRVAAIVVFLCVVGIDAQSDDNVCPCIPISKVWVVQSCETWNCAQAAMVLANGDPNVMTIPTNDTKYGWVIVRQVVAGSAVTNPLDPFEIRSYPTLEEALGGYKEADPNTLPMMLTTINGSALVVHLREAAPPSRRRAAGH